MTQVMQYKESVETVMRAASPEHITQRMLHRLFAKAGITPTTVLIVEPASKGYVTVSLYFDFTEDKTLTTIVHGLVKRTVNRMRGIHDG